MTNLKKPTLMVKKYLYHIADKQRTPKDIKYPQYSTTAEIQSHQKWGELLNRYYYEKIHMDGQKNKNQLTDINTHPWRRFIKKNRQETTSPGGECGKETLILFL